MQNLAKSKCRTHPFNKFKFVNTLSTDGPLQTSVIIAQAVSEKTVKNYTILYMYIAQGQGQLTLGNKILIVS